MVLNQLLLLLALQVLHGVTGTMVKLNNGGFEDIVIAINPGIAEDNKILDNIKDMIKEASTYLFTATTQRFYFKTVKVLIPLTWKPKDEYKRATTESYDKADVIVADPFLKYGDDPYTLQHGGCGEQGRYIHFTPKFLTDENLLNAYGPRGRVFVHEWAHLRWGVFDEYNQDALFYAAGVNEAEATRCSAGITGKYIVPGRGKYNRDCKIDLQTQLYESGCLFIPDKHQNVPASIMYLQSFSSVTEFCDARNHNIRATNMQNKLCNYMSTWEVIMNSTDFVRSSPIRAPPPDPTISLLQKQERALCLVLDVSGSMNLNDRIDRLKQAAEIFLLQIVETGSWVGIVTFNHAATINTNLEQISSDSARQTLADYLPTTAKGGTSICSGLQTGFQVFLKRYQSTQGCEIVLLTDGEDTAIQSCFNEVESSGSIIHIIALGPNAARELERLAVMTGGWQFSATDSLDSNSLMDAFSGISSGSGDFSQQSIQLESKGRTINSQDHLNGTVTIDKTVGNDTFFVVTWSISTYPPGILLTDPKGRQYNEKDFAIDNTNVRTARLKINGTAEAGDWIYLIQNTYSTAQALSIMVTSRAASASVPPVTVKPFMNRDTNKYPSPVVIYAEVSQGFLPLIGAKVVATVEPETGMPEELELFDNGLGADILKNDGIYSRYFISFKANGRHNIKVHVQAKDKTVRRVRRQSQAFYIPGYVENGEIKMNPPRPEPTEEEMQANVGSVNRVATGGSFVVEGVPPGATPLDFFPPSKITDLEVMLAEDSDEFFLSWTSPGNNYDTGKAERYEIKMSENPLNLRDTNFHTATSVNTTGLTTEVAGVKQLFQYKAENFKKENGTSIFFAIRAIDDSNNVGEASNIARALVLLSTLPSTPSTPVEKHMYIATIVSVSAIIFCAVIIAIVYVLRKRKCRSYKTQM